MIDYSVIIPVYNEANYLQSNILKIINHSKKYLKSFEIIISENGSTDNTLHLARKLAGQFSSIKVISSRHADYGQAVKSGFLTARGKYLLLFDLDFFDFDFVNQATALLSSSSAVVASKNSSSSLDNRSVLRQISSKLFSRLLKYLFGLKISDTHGIKILSRADFLNLINDCVTTKETFDTELLIRGQNAGLALSEIPITIKETRPSRTSIIRRSLRAIRDILKLKFILSPGLMGLISILVITFSLLLPSLAVPFSFIDDAYFIEHSEIALQKIVSGDFGFISQVLLEPDTGRVRPIYWLSLFVRYLLLGQSPHLFHLANILIVLGIMYFNYQIFFRFTRSNLWSFLGSLALLIFWRTSENFFRLGPQEPLALLLILASFYLAPAKISFYLGILAIFVKETSIFILPFTFLLLLYDGPKRKFWLNYFLFSLIPLSYLIITRFIKPVSGDYSDNYQVTLSLIISSFQKYREYFDSTWITSLFKISLLSLLLVRSKGYWIGLFWTILSFAVLLPWQIKMGRYLLPVLPGLLLFIVLQSQKIYSSVPTRKWLVIVAFPLLYYWANYLFTNSVQFYNVLSTHIARESANSDLVKYLASVIPNGHKLYFNFPDDQNNLEWLDGSARQLHYLYDRPDLHPVIVNLQPTSGTLLTWSFVPAQFTDYTTGYSKTISYTAVKYQPILTQALLDGFTGGTESFTWRIETLK